MHLTSPSLSGLPPAFWAKPSAVPVKHGPFFRSNAQPLRLTPAASTALSRESRFAGAAVEALTATSREEATSLTVNTRDGDTVTLTLVERESAETSARALYARAEGTDENGRAAVAYSESSLKTEEGSALAYAVTVEGELDEGEFAALDELVGQIDALAGNFFDGNVFAALAQGRALGYDESEIADFSLRLERTETRREITAYTEQMSTAEERVPLPEAVKTRVGRHVRDLVEMEQSPLSILSPESIERLLTALTDRREEAWYANLADEVLRPGVLHAQLLKAGRLAGQR